MLRSRSDEVNVAQQAMAMVGAGASQQQYIPPTRRQQLENQRALLEHQLELVNGAIGALDAHPDLEQFAETLSRAGV